MAGYYYEKYNTNGDSMKRIYMAGAGGMLGKAFYGQFKGSYLLRCSDIDVNEDWLQYCDIRDFVSYRRSVMDFMPDYLFHLGAITDLEACERDQDNAYATNTSSVHSAIGISNSLDIPLLFISTAGIFDGKKAFYDEHDIPNPLSVYAQTKAISEHAVLTLAKRGLVCRAGWMFGGHDKDKKFVAKIVKQNCLNSSHIYVVDDKDGTPTYTVDFAKNTRILIETSQHGLFNMVNNGLTSRFEVADEILKIIESDKKLIKVSSSYFAKQYSAPRPACERLINKRLNDLGMNQMRDWNVALREYLKN